MPEKKSSQDEPEIKNSSPEELEVKSESSSPSESSSSTQVKEGETKEIKQDGIKIKASLENDSSSVKAEIKNPELKIDNNQAQVELDTIPPIEKESSNQAISVSSAEEPQTNSGGIPKEQTEIQEEIIEPSESAPNLEKETTPETETTTPTQSSKTVQEESIQETADIQSQVKASSEKTVAPSASDPQSLPEKSEFQSQDLSSSDDQPDDSRSSETTKSSPLKSYSSSKDPSDLYQRFGKETQTGTNIPRQSRLQAIQNRVRHHPRTEDLEEGAASKMKDWGGQKEMMARKTAERSAKKATKTITSKIIKKVFTKTVGLIVKNPIGLGIIIFVFLAIFLLTASPKIICEYKWATIGASTAAGGAVGAGVGSKIGVGLGGGIGAAAGGVGAAPGAAAGGTAGAIAGGTAGAIGAGGAAWWQIDKICDSL